MGVPKELGPEALYTRSDPTTFDFETTAEVEDGAEIVGQPRAVEAVRFAVGMGHNGYNVYALGAPGTGRQFIVEHFLKEEAANRPVPSDICYVNNFKEPNKPQLLRLANGTARSLKTDMAELVEEILTTLPAAFESEEYQSRLHSTQQDFKEQHEEKLEKLQEDAKTRGFAMLQTPAGIVFAPIRDGDVISQEAYRELPKDEQEQLEKDIEDLQQELQVILRRLPGSERELRGRVRELNKEITEFSIGHLIDELREKYKVFEPILSYLNEVQEDLTHHAREFVQAQEPQTGMAPQNGSAIVRRYAVNVLVDHSDTKGAPVVYEDHPVHENLVGRIEHQSQMGTLVTDFNLIKPGSLHRANGGFLIMDVRRVLMQPYAWEGLKRTLKSKQIRIESPGQALGLVSTVSLEPEPAPLDIKVVLIGDSTLYYLLGQHDPDFAGLFKVAADFDDRLDRSDENEQLLARLIAGLVRKNDLRPFDRAAVARVIEHSARLVGDSERLSGHIGGLGDLLRECDYWAGVVTHDTVSSEEVDKAIDSQVHRMDRIKDRLQEEVLRETIAIDTTGAHVGQVNGLAVLQMGDFAFGKASRITARIRLGKGEVLNIEREVELSGPIHSKGVLILSGFLGARYAADRPLSLSATLVFEQSYSGVDGDSASSTELYALLSAISGVPIRQSLAVTGSVNQHGQVQAIGGANQKIEGFFDLCQARGLTGDQGVLIPKSNVKHLMLRRDVIKAVEAGEFHIYPVATIDEGIELLTGVEAGTASEDGMFPPESINGRVEQRLTELAAAQVAFNKSAESPDSPAEEEQ